jgi:GT2 family glycosyltransferase
VLHHRHARPHPRVPAAPEARPDGGLPSVSVIIPTRNRVDLLATCLAGLAETAYPDLEVIVVDNDSDDPHTLAFLEGLDSTTHRVLRHAGPFNFSTINNRAASEARGEMLCLLNNDIEVIGPDWLSAMVAQALRPHVGAVGARLLYPDGRIQHAGVVLGVGGAAAHAHRLLRPGEEGYFRRHDLPQFVSAVTAACLVVRRDRFLAVDGFDERDFAVAFNDVDLCMRLNRRGWQALYEPRATLIHHESVSRGLDRDPAGAERLAGEIAALRRNWGTDTLVDPFHHPELSPFSERFVVRL